MTHTEFVNALMGILLPDEEYRKMGASEQFIQRLKKSLLPEQRTGIKESGDTDPLIRLVENYRFEDDQVIGMVGFLDQVRRTPAYIYVGKFEVDDIVINTATKEIIILEGGIDHKLWICASNSAAFLDALIHIGTFIEKGVVDNNLYEDEAINLAVAEQTAEIAGGQKYFNFYRTMLGV
jgi:hypothetical protein